MSEFDSIGTIEFFREGHRVESATTARVLGAFPADMLSYRWHPNSSTAGATAWTIVRCLQICNDLTRSSTAEVPRDLHPGHDLLMAQFKEQAQSLQAVLLGMTSHDWGTQRTVTSN